MYGSPGSYVFDGGAYTNDISGFNGIWPNNWGVSSSGLANNGSVISIQDIVDVLRGLPIRHAIKVDLQVTANAQCRPALKTIPMLQLVRQLSLNMKLTV